MLRSLRLKIAVVFSVLISMMFVILGTAVYQLQKEKETHSLDQYSENTMDLVTEQLTAFMQRIEEDMGHYGTHDDDSKHATRWGYSRRGEFYFKGIFKV